MRCVSNETHARRCTRQGSSEELDTSAWVASRRTPRDRIPFPKGELRDSARSRDPPVTVDNDIARERYRSIQPLAHNPGNPTDELLTIYVMEGFIERASESAYYDPRRIQPSTTLVASHWFSVILVAMWMRCGREPKTSTGQLRVGERSVNWRRLPREYRSGPR
jgi:hypothetical protein